LIARKPAQNGIVNGGKLNPNGAVNCATLMAAKGTVNYVDLTLDGATLDGMVIPVLEVRTPACR